jgi:hypothetical protein
MWKVASMKRVQGPGQFETIAWHISHIRVVKDRWTFMQPNNVENASYYISLDMSRKPGFIDWRNTQTGPLFMAGLIRKKDGAVEIVYLASTNRPGSFENPPTGYYLLTLRKE